MSASDKLDDKMLGIIYRDSVEEEQSWRLDPKNSHDVLLIDEMLNLVNMQGCNYNYFTDIVMRRHKDSAILSVLEGYLGKFYDEYITGQLVKVISLGGRKSAIQTILNCYFNLSDKDKISNAFFYDNAIYRIKDKRYINQYLSIIEDKENAHRFPFTMQMMGKWHDENTKMILISYLLSDNEQLLWCVLNALGYYKNDITVINALSDFLNLSDQNTEIRKKAKSVLDKISS